MRNKYWQSILATTGVFVAFFIFIFTYSEHLQKYTCKRTIQFGLVVGMNTKKIKFEMPLNSDWKNLDSTERRQLLDFVAEHRNDYTECHDYSYLMKGEDSKGAELSISARKDGSNRIEIRLGE